MDSLLPRRYSSIVRCRAAWAAVVLVCFHRPAAAREQIDATGRFDVQWWTIADGLPETPLTGLAHAPDGSIVCGSRSRLVRFDGVTFTPFPKQLTEQLHAAIGDFWSLGFDGQGRLWVQGGQALARLDEPAKPPGGLVPGQHWTVYWLPAPQITGLSFGSDGRPICVGPDAVWPFSGTGFTGLSCAAARDAGPAGQRPQWRYGRADPRSGGLWLWAGGGDPTVWRLSWPRSVGQAARLEATTGPAPFAVVSVGTGPGGAVALLADGAAVHRDGAWRRVPLPPFDGGAITSGKIAEAVDRTLWISTHDALLACAEGRVETTIDGLTGFSLFTHCLSPDRRGGIWAACAGGLLSIRRKPGGFDPIPRLTAVFARADGSLLVGSPGEVRRRKKRPHEADEPVATLPRHAVPTAILETPEGRIWVGTQDAFLWRIEDGRAVQVTKPTADPSREVRSITSLVCDDQGRIWVGTANGLAVSAGSGGEAFALVPSHGGTSPLRIVGLAVDRDGSLLVAANGRGVERLLPDGHVEPIVPRRLTPGRQAIVFHRDARDCLWVGGEAGLVRVSVEGEMLRLSTATGLVSDAIRQIEEDAAGRLWVATQDGRLQGMRLDHVDALARSAVGMVRGVVVDLASGLGDAECLGRLTRDRSIPSAPESAIPTPFIVPLDQGIARFDPAMLQPADSAPQPPVVTAGRQDDGVHFEWHAPGMHLEGPPLHQTLLHGVDDGWSAADATGGRKVRSLPPGHYTLAVRRVDGETDADFPLATVDFTVPTPWWRQPWAIATAAAVLVGGGIAVSRGLAIARARRAIADLERQREREKDRARIARDIHDSLGAGLTRMALMSENARRAACSPADLDRRLDALYRDAQSLARTVDEIVWAVNPLHDTLAGFLAFTMQEVEDSARAGGLELDFDVPADPPDVALDAATRHHASLAVREAVQNVLRHAGAARLVYRAHLHDAILEITVADDGRGFDPTTAVADTQDGLRNIRGRIADLGGSVEILATAGHGTTVTMHVPVTAAGRRSGAVEGRHGQPPPSARERHHA